MTKKILTTQPIRDKEKIKEQYKVKCTSCWLVYIKNGK